MTNLFLQERQYVETESDLYTTSERLGAAYDLGLKDTFVGDYFQGETLEELEKGDKAGDVSVEELNQKFPDVEVPFSKPTSFLVANEINQEALEKKELMNIITNHGREGGVGINLIGQLAAHATDPVEAGLDIAVALSTAGLGLLATSALKTGKAGKRTVSA